MDIILKENVANVGFKDELVSVKAGYGRNFLIPSGKAVLTAKSYKRPGVATKISKLELQILVKVGPDGKLFGSISNTDVAKSLLAKKIEVEKENISIPGKSIKRIGKYQASIRLHREVSTQLNFELQAEKK